MFSGNRDRRAAPRAQYICEVESSGLATDLRISDLSKIGAFIDTMAQIPVGSVLRLRFRVADTEIRVNAEVRHSIPYVGVGVRFLDLNPYDQIIIESALASGSKRRVA